jgi:hypothetical protein
MARSFAADRSSSQRQSGHSICDCYAGRLRHIATTPRGGPASKADQEDWMDELNGRMIACQILIAGLIARVANDKADPLSFLTGFRDELKAVVNQIRIAGTGNTSKVRQTAQDTIDELFSLMKPPSTD